MNNPFHHALDDEPDELEPCEHGHFMCSTTEGGRCSNEHPDDTPPYGMARPSLDDTLDEVLTLLREARHALLDDENDEIATNPFGGALDR